MLSEQGSLLQQDKIKLTNAISDISHQLKTPLTSMMVMADLLSDANLPAAKRAEFTQNIRIQLERIDWLVSSLLKLSKIDAGTVQFKKDRNSGKRLIQKALEPVLIPMDIKEQTVSIKGEDTVSFLGDLNWTAEALINILKNCVEHTQEGGELPFLFQKMLCLRKWSLRIMEKASRRKISRIFLNVFTKERMQVRIALALDLQWHIALLQAKMEILRLKVTEGKGTQFRIKFYKQL